MKKYKIVIIIFFISNLFCASETSKFNLMPYPSKIEVYKGIMRINEKFLLKHNNISERLNKASNRFLERLAKRTGLFLEFPFADTKNDTLLPIFNINSLKEDEVQLVMDESYELIISNSYINLNSKTDIGALRGLETLLQLLQSDSIGYYFPSVKINDSPRFPWRGVLIDVCRHFMPIEVIKRNLDGMASVKMNVLHLHLSEDQGFRVESKTYPKLHELASDGKYFTHEQIKEIINYAHDRGIRVVPEFDVPGHATAILTAYPELASAPGPYEIERDWGIFDSTLNPIIDTTYIFLENLFREMSELFTDEYFHIGGDENNGKQWDANNEIQEFMKANNLEDNNALQGYFNNKVLKILSNIDKKMVGWDEILHPSMPKDIVIQSWRGKESLIQAATQGYHVILSNGYYIDLMQPTDFHYLNNPLPEDVRISEENKKYILGGEATMWAEMISPETIDSRIWPRTAAIAERLWSSQSINNVDDMYRRLENVSYQLEEHGLTHIKNYEMMLRRLTNNNDIEPLRILISVIEPVKIYNRYRLKPQTQQTPLTRVVDAAVADAKAAREFRKLVDLFLLDKKNIDLKEMIIQKLEIWRDNHAKLLPILKQSPVLFEIIPMSERISKLSKFALEILNDKNLSEEFILNGKELIEKSKEPIAQTELMIVSSVEKLYDLYIK